MSEGRLQAAERDAVTSRTQFSGSKLRFFRTRSIVRWVALLYSVYFLVEPAYRHSLAVWVEFAILYAAFLTLYFLVAELAGRARTVAFLLFFLIAFVYYWFSAEAYGTFAYPFAMLCLSIRRLRWLFVVLAAMMGGIVAESLYLGRSFSAADNTLLLCVIFGLGNFAFAQQARTNSLLEQANLEIERLSQEAERERIARDLHDLLGHTLTAIAVKLDLARRLLSHSAPLEIDRVRTEIVEAEQTARNALAEVREAVSGYRATGLDAEIGRARQSLRSAHVELTTAIAAVNLPSSHVNVLCLALREAVTNIVRHARATACRVTLVADGDAVGFAVEDNGVGEGVGVGVGETIREGNGLKGMRERVESIGGEMKLARPANGGTRVELTLPRENELQERSALSAPASSIPAEREPL